MSRFFLIIITIMSLAITTKGCHSAASSATANDIEEEEVRESAFRNEAPQTDEPLYLDDSNMLVAGVPCPKRPDNDATAGPPHARRDEVYPCATCTASSAKVNRSSSDVTTRHVGAPTTKVPNRGEMYVHTWGAQGEVWGTVMMNGNVGHGTVHDAEEHTYAIRVARRGISELVGTDQNGREYIFKL